MRSLLLVLWLLLCVGAAVATPCENDVPCDKCVKDSEFAWNPEDRYVTPRLQRFYTLDEKIKAAYERNDKSELAKHAHEYLELAAIYRCNWNYGNAIHDANRYLGLASLRDGNVEDAAKFLVLSGQSTGSPQLNSFGPDLDLANQLLKHGKTDPVREYLRDIKRFWKMDNGQIDQWLSAIDRGEKPELDRFLAMKPSPWMIALWWLVIGLPALAAVWFVYIGRKTLPRKALFLVVGTASGYATLLLLNWGMAIFLTQLAVISESTGEFGVFLMVYLPIVLALSIPILVVFGLFRYFSTIRQRDAR